MVYSDFYLYTEIWSPFHSWQVLCQDLIFTSFQGLSWGLFLPMDCVWKWCVSSLRMSFWEVDASASWLDLVSGWLCHFVSIHKWNISCHISKQGFHSHQQLQLSKVSQWALRKLGKWEHRILAPDSWGAYQRNDFSDPRVLHFPTWRKALNSLRFLVFFN